MPDERDVSRVPKRVLGNLMNSLSAGVVPRVGAPYIAIGRNDEVNALKSDLAAVAEGGSSMRFIIGKYGSGKSFLIQLIRGYALESGFVTVDGDLSPERKLIGGNGAGLASYRELMRNMSTKTSQDGGALQTLIGKWLSGLQSDVASEGISPDSPTFAAEVDKRVYTAVRELEGQVGGFDFAAVISRYYRAVRDSDDDTVSLCLRWLRGEFQTKTEAKKALGVQSIITDGNWYDYLKLWAHFARSCGYKGLLVLIDECVNLYKISNRISRENNYEMILTMFNDTLQGRAPGVMIIMGGTPQFMEDTRRGLFSYEALRSRLTEGRFVSAQYINMMGPVMRLRRLSGNELFALITRLTALHSQLYKWQVRVTPDEQARFLEICESRIGADTMITPREIIRDYLSLLNILYQNPEASFASLTENIKLSHDDVSGDDDLPDEASASGEYSGPRVVTLDDLTF